MANTAPFDNHLPQYEQWFTDNHFAFLSEIEALRKVLPTHGKGVEIGIGSGIFALPLGIKEGCDPSAAMREKAVERGINAIDGIAENLPYKDGSIDFVLIVTTICFVDDVNKTFQEIFRVLKTGGAVIVAFVDKNRPVGNVYLQEKEKSVFYRDANFFSTEEVYKFLWGNGFIIEKTCQTLFGKPGEVKEIQQPEKSSGKGSFVIIKAKKIKDPADMSEPDKKNDLILTVNHFISEEKYGEAINYLQKIIETDGDNKEAATLMGQLKKILEYQNRDIFGSTNLNMDPWFE
jgi:ubiquinone/menaquinone biosynthesis C-methylase UbiE